MPLTKSASKEAFRTNVAEMIRSGKPRDQALAASYRNARHYGAKYAEGGAPRTIGWDRGWQQREPLPINRDGADFIMREALPPGRSLYRPDAKFDLEGDWRARPAQQKFADGGTPWIERTSAHGLSHQGMIHSAVPGRTDKLPISVAGGAYILPADHVSALGQGNSQAGADVVNRVFKMGPYAGNPLGRMGGGPKAIRPTVPKLGRMGGKSNFARGGAPSVPIIAAGGEYAIPPEKVAELGGGDMDRGHRILDAWVKSTRKQHIRTLRGLKPPKK